MSGEPHTPPVTVAPNLRVLYQLKAAGFRPKYQSSKDGYRQTLRKRWDLVIVAGGDGTVARVARRLRNRDIPLAILPIGTANNIARALGLNGDIDSLISHLRMSKPKRLDIGVARCHTGTAAMSEPIYSPVTMVPLKGGTRGYAGNGVPQTRGWGNRKPDSPSEGFSCSFKSFPASVRAEARLSKARQICCLLSLCGVCTASPAIRGGARLPRLVAEVFFIAAPRR